MIPLGTVIVKLSDRVNLFYGASQNYEYKLLHPARRETAVKKTKLSYTITIMHVDTAATSSKDVQLLSQHPIAQYLFIVAAA